MMINFVSMDHLVMTVSDMDVARHFYHDILGMPLIDSQTDDEITTLQCGQQLLRLQTKDRPLDELQANCPTPGAIDLCITSRDEPQQVMKILKDHHVKTVLEGINVDSQSGLDIETGAKGKMQSIYLRDPDQNLIEISFY
ncbi:MAG TPA: VOC family protein [Limosilactobacillus coleohominis]|nr:VOC family protein [Limosilactobacillus coleohominis]